MTFTSSSVFRTPGARALAWLMSAAAVVAAGAGPVRAEATEAGIVVAGAGEAKGKPSSVEITATVSGDAELAADATVKYRDTKRRALEALNGLKIAGLTVEPGGFAINQGVDSAQAMAMMQGNAAGPSKQQVQVAEQLKIVLSGLDKLKDEELMETVLKVIDTGRDAGLVIGRGAPRNYYEMQMMYNSGGAQGGALVTFKLADADALREQAYKAAMADARGRAERLANLAGVKLGKIVAVRDSVAGPENNAQAAMMAAYGAAAARAAGADLSSGVFSEIPIKVNLSVQFEIAK